jgi:hypothetical protein
MKREITHLWSEESTEAKVRWFSSLADEERFELFCEYIEFLVELNPGLVESAHAEAPGRSVRVLEQP